MPDCLFCNLSESKHDPALFWQSQYFFCYLDAFPVNPGHYLIIPKKHVVELNDLSFDEWQDLKQTIKISREQILNYDLENAYRHLIEKKISPQSINYCQDVLTYLSKYEFQPDAFNIGINDGEAAGRTVHHLHTHVIPRFKGDVIDPTGGVRGVIGVKQQYGKSEK